MIQNALPPQFINWRLENGTKVPCDSQGRKINAHSRRYWLTYDGAKSVSNRYGHGIAFVIDIDDPWFFLDLDKCLDVQTNTWTPEATAIFSSFNGAWGEVSQSGRGLHILGKCDKSKLADRRNKWDGWLEFYMKERFVAFGSNDWQPIGGTLMDRDWTDQLLKFVPEREYLGPLPDGRDPTYTGPENDAELIQMAMRSKSTASAFGEGITFSDLWMANKPVLARRFPDYDGVEGEFDHSSADMALMSHLAFWTGKDMPRMDRLFRLSALMREKYEKRDDYRKDTVQKAARLCSKVYDKPRQSIPQSQIPVSMGGTNEVLLTIQEQIEHFNGCVYIRDAHRVLVPDGALLKPEQFKATYGGHQFMVADNMRPTTDAFTALTQNCLHDFPKGVSTCFRPDLEPGHILEDGRVNIYVDPEIQTEPGDIGPFLLHLEKILPNAIDRDILMGYLAGVVQMPGVKFQWCPVLQGVEGNGKTLFARCVQFVVGKQYCHTPDAQQLGEKYNSYLEGNQFIIVEEIHMSGRREMLDKLKPLITNDYVEVRAMAKDKYMAENVANWFMSTNHMDAVLKSKNDRRYAIFFTAQQSREDLDRDGMNGSYFPDLYDWLKGGGYKYVGHYLRNYVISPEFKRTLLHRAPDTSSSADAIAISIGPIEQEILEACESMLQGFRANWISSWCLDGMLKNKNLKVSRNRLGLILKEMGYVKWGRSPQVIVREGNSRPSLWYKGDITKVTLNDYLSCQGWS